MKLDKTEVEIFRTPDEYIQWFGDILSFIHENKTTNNRDALLHNGDFKLVYEELFPIYSLLRFKKSQWKCCRFRNIIGSQNYDAEIEGLRIKHLEISVANFDEGEVYRMEQLMKNGSVDALAPIRRGHRRRPIGFEDEGEMKLHSNVVKRIESAIISRLENKSRKNYPRNTALLVYFDDATTAIDEDDQEQLKGILNSLRDQWCKVFDWIFLVGPKASVCIEQSR